MATTPDLARVFPALVIGPTYKWDDPPTKPKHEAGKMGANVQVEGHVRNRCSRHSTSILDVTQRRGSGGNRHWVRAQYGYMVTFARRQLCRRAV